MSFAPLPHPTSHLHPSRSPSSDGTSRGQRFLNALSYSAAVALGLTVAPAMVILADRGTFLHWANYILDVVGSH